MSYVVATDPELVKAAQAIWEQMMHPSAPKLGLDWRIVIERNGKPAAEVIRTRDKGIKIGFYGDEPGGSGPFGF